MKICFFLQGTEGYGVQRRIRSLAEPLVQQGHSVTAIACQKSAFCDQLAEIIEEVTIMSVPPPGDFGSGTLNRIRRFAKSIKQSKAVSKQLAFVLSTRRPEHLVFAHSHLISVVGAACRNATTPVRPVWLMPNLISDRYPFALNKRFYRYQAKKYSVDVIGNSLYTFRTLYGDSRTPRVVHLGVDATKFAPPSDNTGRQELRSKLGIKEDATVIGIFSRLIPMKGQLVFAEALGEYLKENPRKEIHLLICGGPYPTEYSEAIERLGKTSPLEGRLHLLGMVEKPEEYMPACDVLANPHQGAEPFGNSVIEAMLMSKPILVRGLGGPAETVLDGETGWHVAGASAADFKEGIRRVMLDESRWVEMGVKARSHCLDNFTNHHMAKRLCKTLSTPVAA